MARKYKLSYGSTYFMQPEHITFLHLPTSRQTGRPVRGRVDRRTGGQVGERAVTVEWERSLGASFKSAGSSIEHPRLKKLAPPLPFPTLIPQRVFLLLPFIT